MSGGDEMGAEGRTDNTATAEIRKIGYLRKLKTLKKKFFVLKAESGAQPACLEYYDNEKKWKAGGQPKRTIVLKTCFNINRKLDTKQKHALALYTKDDCFTVVLDNAEELDEWLGMLLALQHGDESLAAHQPPKPSFEHVWQVNVRNRGLGSSKNILGPYHLCLTSQILSLVKLNSEEQQVIEFPLMSIRRCGHSYCFFFMELGRSAVTGSGELWMQTEDVIIAQNMHETILNAMRSSTKEEVTPRQRARSSSTNEASKPISVRRQATVVPPVGLASTPTKRERSDSVPTRSRTVSDNQHDVYGRLNQTSSHETQRPHSMYAHSSSYSPPGGAIVPSPCSAPGTIDSGGSSLSIEDPFDISHLHLPISENSYQCQTSIMEEGGSFDDYLPMTPPDQENVVGRSSSPAHLYRTLSSKRASTSSISPSVLGSSKKSTSPSQQPDYLEMTSSIANSPAGSEGYMAMNLLGNSLPDVSGGKPGTPEKLYLPMSPTGSLSVGSRKTSTDENANGYVPMAPLSIQSKSPEEEGYMDMTPTKQTLGKQIGDEPHVNFMSTPPVVTSGTPSTDVRFSEFQLDKVRTYFTPCDDDERLVRAYSVGSKPKPSQSLAIDEESSSSSSRVRAFSVGSKVGMKFGKKSNAEAGAARATSAPETGKKCSSAPLLSTSWSGQSGFFKTTGHTSEDLMEMDFAKSNGHSRGSSDLQQQQNKSGFRPRTSSRSSSGRPTKSDWLQAIGEMSGSSKKQAVSNEYVEYEAGATETDEQSSRNAVKKRSESPSSGEYVNIDMNKRSPSSNKINDKPIGGHSSHEYVNIQVGCLTSSRKPNKEVLASDSSSFLSASSASTSMPSRESPPKGGGKSNLFSKINRRSLSESPYQNISFGKPLKSRPASVSSDRELNYASLDLMASEANSSEEEGLRSSVGIKSGDGESTKLAYAKIDFTKIEGLKLASRDNILGKKEK